MLLKISHGIFCFVALLIIIQTSAQVFYRLSSKEDDVKEEDEEILFLTESFFACGSNDDCTEIAKKKGKRRFKMVIGQKTIGEEYVVYKKVTDPSIDCQDAYNKGFKVTRVLPIYIPGMNPANVRCDMVTDGGGWIVFQRRVDASVDFYRGWDEYKNGFGDLNGNFWLGLEKIHKLTSLGKRAILRVDLKHFRAPNKLRYALYNQFKIANESEGYKLTVNGYSGNAGNSLAHHNNRKFSTKDHNNDVYSVNCAHTLNGAWWYYSCAHSNLNGIFPDQNEEKRKYISWTNLYSSWGGITFSEMKFRYPNP